MIKKKKKKRNNGLVRSLFPSNDASKNCRYGYDAVGPYLFQLFTVDEQRNNEVRSLRTAQCREFIVRKVYRSFRSPDKTGGKRVAAIRADRIVRTLRKLVFGRCIVIIDDRDQRHARIEKYTERRNSVFKLLTVRNASVVRRTRISRVTRYFDRSREKSYVAMFTISKRISRFIPFFENNEPSNYRHQGTFQ